MWIFFICGPSKKPPPPNYQKKKKHLRGSFQLSFHICGNVSILYITSEVFNVFSKFKKQMKEYKILEFLKYKIFSEKIFQVKGDPPKITIAANVKAHKKAKIQ